MSSKDIVGLISGLVVPLLVLIVGIVISYRHGGVPFVWKGYQMGLGMIGAYFLPICIMMLIAGQISAYAMENMATINKLIDGSYGLWGALGIGIFAPSLSGYPEVERMWDNPAVSKLPMYAYFVASRTVNLQTSLFFIPFLGWRLSAVMFGVCMAVCVALTLVLQIISWLRP